MRYKKPTAHGRAVECPAAPSLCSTGARHVLLSTAKNLRFQATPPHTTMSPRFFARAPPCGKTAADHKVLVRRPWGERRGRKTVAEALGGVRHPWPGLSGRAHGAVARPTIAGHRPSEHDDSRRRELELLERVCACGSLANSASKTRAPVKGCRRCRWLRAGAGEGRGCSSQPRPAAECPAVT